MKLHELSPVPGSRKKKKPPESRGRNERYWRPPLYFGNPAEKPTKLVAAPEGVL